MNKKLLISFFIFLNIFIFHYVKATVALNLVINDSLKEWQAYQPHFQSILPEGWRYIEQNEQIYKDAYYSGNSDF